MRIEEQFNQIAEEYDSKRKLFIPCYDDFYISTTDLICGSIPSPAGILDLGAGTGLLTMYWFRKFPQSEFVLCDIAEDMLAVARKRFSGADNFDYRITDYSRQLPEGNFDAVISALSIHHLGDDEKYRLFGRIYDLLPDGGVFVNYDQFNYDNPKINNIVFNSWEQTLEQSGLTKDDLVRWKERVLLDKECSVEKEIGMLKNSGFSVAECMYKNGKFAVILCVK